MERKQMNLRAFLVPFLGVFAYSLVSFAGVRGGSGTGGGDYILGTKVTQAEAANELAQIKPYVRAALNFLDVAMHSTVNNTPDEFSEATQKLFDGKKTVFDLLKVVQVDALQSAPCRDSAGAPKAGSVYDTSPDEICLSVQTASEQLTSDNLFPQLVGIYVHELTHKMGGDETLARFVQTLVVANVSNTSQQNFESTKEQLVLNLKDELKAVNQLSADVDDGNDFTVGEDLSALKQDTNNADSTMSEAYYAGLTPLDKARWIEVGELSVRAGLTHFYALPTGFKVNGKAYNVETTVLTMNKLVTDQHSLFQNDHDEIIQVGYHDKAALKKVIQQIKSATIDLMNALHGDAQ